MKIYTSKYFNIVIGFIVSFIFTVSSYATQVEQSYTTAYRYNLLGQITGTISPDPDATRELRLLATRNTYNAQGLLVIVEKGELSTWPDETTEVADWTSSFGFTIYSKQVLSYDNYGRKSSSTSYGKNNEILELKEYSYDVFSRLECTAIRMNFVASGSGSACTSSNLTGLNPDRITRLSYNDYDQIVTEERALLVPVLAQIYTKNVFNPSSHRLESQYDANGNKTEYYYDGNGQVRRVIFPSPTVKGASNGTAAGTSGDYVDFQYDNNGNKTYERKRNGAVINYTIDNNNRVIFKDYLNNTNQRDISYDYDLRGLQILESFGAAATADRTAQKYDGFGNLLTDFVYMGGITRAIYSRYDLNNNRTRVSHGDGNYFTYQFDGMNRMAVIYEGSGTRMLQIDYSPDGHRKRIYRRDGISTTNYTFTNGVQMDSFTQDFPNNSYDLTNTFQYNSARQISQLTLGNNLYYYQGNQNRTGNYTVNGLNQYTYVGGATQGTGQPMGYDLNGNLTNDGSSVYQYDDENRLIGTSGNIVSSFTYDPRGRLFQSIINGVKTQFLYDGDALVAEYDNAGVMQRRYVHGDQVDEPLVQYNSSAIGLSSWRYLHSDHQGSIIAQSDVNGAVLSTSAYDSFGIPATVNTDRFGYTGQIWFKDLGLFYYKARVYHPKLGRFLQTDPIGYKDQMNLYAYVGNDPINKTDPTGLYGRGDGFSDEQWKKFDKLQQKAAGAMEKRAGKLEAKADKLDAKGKSGGDNLRSAAGSLRGGAASLRSDGSDGKMANAVDGATYQSMGGSQDGGAFVPRSDRNLVYINTDNKAAWGGSNALWAIGHESLHSTGVELSDQRGSNGEKAYKYGSDDQRASFKELKGTDQGIINPDNLMNLVY